MKRCRKPNGGLTKSELYVKSDLEQKGVKVWRIDGGSGDPDFGTSEGYVESKVVQLTPAQVERLPHAKNLKFAIVLYSRGFPIGKIVYINAAEFFGVQRGLISADI